MMWIMLILAAVLIVGNLMLLLRTARKPKIPAGFKPKADDEEADGW